MVVSRSVRKSTSHGTTRAIIQTTDMTEEMQSTAVNTALDALEMYRAPVDIAAFIKKSFDLQLHPGWLCVVGRSFGRRVYVKFHPITLFSTVSHV